MNNQTKKLKNESELNYYKPKKCKKCKHFDLFTKSCMLFPNEHKECE